MKTFKHMDKFLGLALAGFVASSTLLYVACDSSDNAVKEKNPDGGPSGDGAVVVPAEGGLIDGPLPDGAPGDCFMNPTTHFEIINACTDAVKITKNPTLPLLYADGGLPPLP